MISLHISSKDNFSKGNFLKLSNVHNEDHVDTVDNAKGRSATICKAIRLADPFRLAKVHGCIIITLYSSYFVIECKWYHFLSFKRQLFKGKLCKICKLITTRTTWTLWTDNAKGRSATICKAIRLADPFRLAKVHGCMNITVYSSYFVIKWTWYLFISFKKENISKSQQNIFLRWLKFF